MFKKQVLELSGQLGTDLGEFKLCVSLVADLLGELMRCRKHEADVETDYGSHHVEEHEEYGVPKCVLSGEHEEDHVEKEENDFKDGRPHVDLR